MIAKSTAAPLRLVRDAGQTPVLIRYPVALVVVVTTAFIRSWLFHDEAPWFLFEAACVLIALGFGLGPAVLAVAASTLAAAQVVSSPAAPLGLRPVHWLASAVFVVVTFALVALVEALRSALLRADALLETQVQDRAALAERSGFLSSVLASSTDCIKVLDLEGRLTFMSEGGQKVMEVSDFNLISGCPWPSFWEGSGNADATAALIAARAGRSTSFLGRADTFAGTSKWWHVAVSPILDRDGRPERILSVSRDITALRESEAERDRYARVIENSDDFIGMARLDGSVFFLNDAGRNLVGLDKAQVARVTVADFFPPDQAEDISAVIFPAVKAMGRWSGERLFRHFGTGELIPVFYSVFPVQDAAGELIGFGTVTRDIRPQKEAEASQAMVNGEISHRLKNVLAMVQALASQTLRNAAEPQALDVFNRRLAALGMAQDSLLRGDWRAAELGDLVRSALDLAGVTERCEVDGPSVRLGARATLSTSLMLHELATNAYKYGSLTRPEGVVSISWRIGSGPEEAAELIFSWVERGGPPATAPTRKGFGSRLLRVGLVGTGRSNLCYEPSGFSACFTAPLKELERA